MGQLADDVLCGFMCETCGTCFQKEHGHPVVCRQCWKALSEEKRAGRVKATHKEV
jgi:hypothetical protein